MPVPFAVLSLPVKDGLNALHLAASGGKLSVVKYLCGKFGPAKYDFDCKAQNCLHWASREGFPKVVQYLIEEQGFDPSLMDNVSVQHTTPYRCCLTAT